MGYGYPPCGQTDGWKDRRVSKHYLPVVLCTRAVKSPTCEVVHETNKAHFRNLPNRFLPSSVGKLNWLSANETLPLCSRSAGTGTTTGCLLLKGRHNSSHSHSQKDGTRSTDSTLVAPLPNEESLKLGTIAARPRGLLIDFNPEHKNPIMYVIYHGYC